MPNLLKRETRQRLEASQKALYEGLAMAQVPQISKAPSEICSGAIEIGLIGCAAELAISACLFEVLGTKGVLRKEDGFYLTASQAWKRFRELLRSGVPKTRIFTGGVEDEASHLKSLEHLTSKFGVLFTARASGIHAGESVSSQVVLHAANEVANFLDELAKGSKWAPYLSKVARPVAVLKEQSLLVDELMGMLPKVENSEKARTLASVFLVLPELPDNEPDWLASLERVQITPKKGDITILIEALRNAQVGNFSKVGKGVKAIPVRIVSENDPNALPIYSSHLKKLFTNPYELWRADIGTANSNLEQGVVHTPPINQLYHFSAVGLGGVGIPDEELDAGLGAHDIWPFIASALLYQGTVGPCFFLARRLKQNQLGQLYSLLLSAAKLKKQLNNRMSDYWPLLEAASTGEQIPPSSVLLNKFVTALESRDLLSQELPEKLESIVVTLSGKERNASEQVLSVCQDSGKAGETLKVLLENRRAIGKAVNRLGRPICLATGERDDLIPLTSLVTSPELSVLHAEARKGIRDIDFALYGPKVLREASK